MPSALVPLTDGVEEMEAVIVIDALRRAKWRVVSAGMVPGVITASRGVKLAPDALWDDVARAEFDVLVLPGGAAGVAALSRDERVLQTVREFMRDGKIVAAICAGPLVLQAAGVLEGRRLTSHPAVKAQLTQGAWQTDRVVVDGRLITSQGPGTAFEFVLALVALVEGRTQARALGAAMLVKE